MRTSRITLKREILIEDENWDQREKEEAEEEEEEEEEKEETKRQKKKNFFIDLRMWLVSPSFGILHHHH